jgi:large subunit ribosomal protein L10
MAKTRDRKETDVTQYADALKAAKSVVFADISSLKVNENGAFRREADNNDVSVTASKKTLLRLALKKADIETVDEAALSGSIYLMATQSDEIAPAKLVASFRKKHEGIQILGGIMESKWLSADEINALAKLPSKDELIAQVVGSIRAPLSGLVNVMQGNLRGLVQVLNAVKEAKA